MSVELTRPNYGFFSAHSSARAGPRHRKRSSSLFALADLRLPSPPLSPSVSINFTKDTNVTGEIPIIFDFLTTSSMPSEERISKMARLEPTLPPLAKFSPMSAFFPMSDSSRTLNTISTEAFGTERRNSQHSEPSQRRYSTLSDYSAVYSPSSSDFNVPTLTEAVNHEVQENAPQDSIVTSTSMPAVHVLDYDVGQKKLGDISDFTISDYLNFPSVHADTYVLGSEQSSDQDAVVCNHQKAPTVQEAFATNPNSSGNGNRFFPPSLLSAPVSPDEDDKTPTQSMFFKRHTQNSAFATQHPTNSGIEASRESVARSEGAPSLVRKDSLSAPPSPDDDDKTPTQTMFLKRRTQEQSTTPSCTDAEVRHVSVKDVSPGRGSTLNIPFSPNSDDKTPTQATFLKRQINMEALAFAPPIHVTPAEAGDALLHVLSGTNSEVPNSGHQLLREKALPPPPEVDIDEPLGQLVTYDPTIPSSPISRNVLPVPCLKHAQWLRDTIVELWIDQEGFRAIRPKFFLASVSNGLPYSYEHYNPAGQGIMDPVEEHDPLYMTVAEFLPVSRAPHYFHHAALDRGPTLHRVTTGDENRDHITRAATISLRDNGVFFIHGTEDHRIDADSLGSGGRIIRLNWRFEYFVSNRRPDGRSAHRGEKVITPLSFSCTPALLDRSRAHKVTVLHIMKKTLLPNLVAQKLEPPDLGPIPQTHGSASSLASFLTQSMATSESRASLASYVTIKNTTTKVGVQERRGSGSGSENNACTKQSFAPLRLKPPTRPPLPYTKHRRGSHSDTTPEDYLRQRNQSDSHTLHERSHSVSSVGRTSKSGAFERVPPRKNVPLVGPIIPRDELIKMMDSQTGPDSERRPHSIRVEVVNNVQITTLPAAPRHKHNP